MIDFVVLYINKLGKTMLSRIATEFLISQIFQFRKKFCVTKTHKYLEELNNLQEIYK